MMNETLASIMDRDVPTLTPNDALRIAREMLLRKGLHYVPILEERKLVGLITTWDLFKLGISSAAMEDMKCRDIMTTHIATLEPNEHIGAAAEVILEHLFNAVPIVDDDHNFLGMVTTYELIRYEYGREYPSEADKYK